MFRGRKDPFRSTTKQLLRTIAVLAMVFAIAATGLAPSSLPTEAANSKASQHHGRSNEDESERSRRSARADTPDATGCDRIASASGNDNASGVPGQPVKTFGRLIATLQTNETGCLAAGEVFQLALGEGIINKADVTVRSTANGAAIVRGYFAIYGDGVKMERLKFDGVGTLAPGRGNVLINILASRVILRKNVITGPRNVCVQVGKTLDPKQYGPGYVGTPEQRHTPANNVTIDQNRIYGCGSAITDWVPADSGAHGIYAQHGNNLVVSNNYIYGNSWRGMQTWPGFTNVQVVNNVFDANDSAFSIGAYPSTGWFTTYLSLKNNVISNSVFKFAKNQYQVAAPDMPFGNTGNNMVELNCFFHVNPAANLTPSGKGFFARNNILGGADSDPRYLDRTAFDFRIPNGSPCAGKGPLAEPPLESGAFRELGPLILAPVAPDKNSTVSTAYPDISFDASGFSGTPDRAAVTSFLLCPGAICAAGTPGAIDIKATGEFSLNTGGAGGARVRHERWWGVAATSSNVYKPLADGLWTATATISEGRRQVSGSWSFTVAKRSAPLATRVSPLITNRFEVIADIPAAIKPADVHLAITTEQGLSDAEAVRWVRTVAGQRLTWTHSAWDPGNYTVSVIVTSPTVGDSRTNWSFLIDQSAPAVSPVIGTARTKRLSSTATDNSTNGPASGMAKVEFRYRAQNAGGCVWNQMAKLVTDTESPFTASIALPRGSYWVWAQGTDKAGNTAYAKKAGVNSCTALVIGSDGTIVSATPRSGRASEIRTGPADQRSAGEDRSREPASNRKNSDGKRSVNVPDRLKGEPSSDRHHRR
jgi:hypothetical protein